MSEPRFVFLHGFTQTHHHWHTCARLIAAARRDPTDLVFVDLPGHGVSVDDRTPLDDAAESLVATAGTGTYIGYSMGARYALAVACAGSPAVERLVLIGGTAGIASPDERRARRADDTARAERIERVGVTTFVDEWLAQPLFAGLQASASDREHRLRNSAAGLASSLLLSGTGAQRSRWDELDKVAVPTLVLAGGDDVKFIDIGRRLASGIRDSTFATIPGAGHAAHAEQPAVAAGLIVEWLDRAAPQPTPNPIANSAP